MPIPAVASLLPSPSSIAPGRWMSAAALVVTLLSATVACGSSSTSTTLTISMGGSPVTVANAGTAVTLTATVKSGSTLVTPGVVNFCDRSVNEHCSDSALLGTAQLTVSGTASIKIRFGVGTHEIQAMFTGTPAGSPSQSTTVSLDISGQYGSQTAFSETPIFLTNPTQTIFDFSAVVTGMPRQASASGPTGTVKFIDLSNSGSLLAQATLRPGPASNNFPFYVAQNPTVGIYPDGIAVGDLNGDGIPDLAIVDFDNQDLSASRDLSILIGNGDGTFQPQKTYVLPGTGGPFPTAVAVGDFNSDGKLDVAVADASSPAAVAILLGNGDGTLQPAVSYPVTITPQSLSVADLNGDGNLDLVVVGSSASTPGGIAILLGKGDGTFQPATYVTSVTGTYSGAVGDFNNDGIPDIVTVNSNPNADYVTGNTISVLLGKGDGTFLPPVDYTVGNNPDAVAIGDFNNDGNQDLAVLNTGPTVSILLGNGTGSFESATLTDNNLDYNAPSDIVAADFNGDGITDLVVTSSTTQTVSLLPGRGDGTFAPPQIIPVQAPATIAVGDFNGDGLPDLAGANGFGFTTATILLNSGANVATATAEATLSAPLSNGIHQLEAVYSGDANYQPSDSNPVSLDLPRSAVSLSLTSTATNVPAGTPFTLSLNLTWPSNGLPAPTGTFVLSDSGSPIESETGTAPSPSMYSSNEAAYPLYPGTHIYTYSYSGDEYWNPSSVSVTVMVTPIGTIHYANLGSVFVGSSSNNTVALTFNRAATLGSIHVLTQGLTGLDFQQESPDGGTCKVGTKYAAGEQCNVNVTFAPRGLGVRMGAITLYDSVSAVIETKYLSGIGNGGVLHNTSQLTQLAPASGDYQPYSVVADAAGDLYVGDYGYVWELLPDGTTKTIATSLSGSYNFPVSVALDGVGNLYFAILGNASVGLPWFYIMPAGSSYFTVVDTGLYLPATMIAGLAVDGAGKVYLVDQSHNRIVILFPGEYFEGESAGWPDITAVAVDGSGDLFFTYGNHAVEQVPEPAGTILNLGTNLDLPLNHPTGIAVDAANTVYVADSLNQRVVSLYANGTKGEIGINMPQGVATDGLENLYITQPNEGALSVYQRSQLPTLLDFGQVTVGKSGTYSLQLTNIGNAALHLSPVVSPSQYKVVGGCAPFIAANTTCTLQLSFTPTAGSASPGTTVSGTLTLNPDHSPIPVPAISLTGQAISATP